MIMKSKWGQGAEGGAAQDRHRFLGVFWALSLVQIHPDTAFWFVGIMVLLRQKDTAQDTHFLPFLYAFMAGYRTEFCVIYSEMMTLFFLNLFTKPLRHWNAQFDI